MPATPTPISVRDFIEAKLPDLLQSGEGYRTQKASLTFHPYEGIVNQWTDFDQKVSEYCENHPPPADLLYLRPPNQQQAPWEEEVYLCAEEKGVEGRFNNNVMDPVERAASKAHLSVRLGDFKATKEAQYNTGSRHYPDFACMTRDYGDPRQNLRFVGECKADWRNQMLNEYNNWAEPPPGRPAHEVPIRPWISKFLSKS